MLSSEHGRNNVATLLIENGAKVNMPNKDDCTALMMACSIEKNEVVQVLIDNHADTSIQNKDGKTAYDWARKKGPANLYNLVFIASSSPTVKSDVTTDSTSESPSPGLIPISASSSLADHEQNDHFTNTSES